MATYSKIFPNLYQDSVTLMQLTAKLSKIPGVDQVSVAMATTTNLHQLRVAGLGDKFTANPNDLIVAVSGSQISCEKAIAKAKTALLAKPKLESNNQQFFQPLSSLEMAFDKYPGSNLALISVPGSFAAAEAMKALRLGLNVMLFSNDVPTSEELQLKTYAHKHGLLLMGPDCGTAIINGVPLGFVNRVRKGSIGIVAASGTGMQEVACRIDRLGEGISQAIGTGGNDLSEAIGGITTLQAIRSLEDDERTKVIVIISKPPARRVVSRVLDLVAKIEKPKIIHFLGEECPLRNGIFIADNLAHAADLAVSVLRNEKSNPAIVNLSDEMQQKLMRLVASLPPSRKYLRGVFAGGTFCYEAQLICQKLGIVCYSNVPVKGNQTLADAWVSEKNSIIDLGTTGFTKGYAHPMIDPRLRDQRIIDDARDKTTAVVLFDLVLGYGACANPAANLSKVITELRRMSTNVPLFIAHVCGTDADSQCRTKQVNALEKAGVLVTSSNAEAARFAGYVIRAQSISKLKG